jgi:xanthine dehydrogenase YagR molybdenum-binding subunit
MHAHGAVFAEVKVDPELGQTRATRLVGAFAAGTIINPRLVRSQYYGGMIWGVSFALYERAALDPRSGRVMNANLAEYHVPVNADVPSLEAILVEESDPHVNALGIKGVGEIGITGTAGGDRQCRVARNRGSRSPLSDHHRAADRSGSGLGKGDPPSRESQSAR